MKNFNKLSAAMLMLCCVFACKKSQIETPAPVEPDYYTVQFGWDGDILEVTEEPLVKGNSTNDLFGIQVYSTPNKEDNTGTSVKWTPFAYGLFDHGDDLTVNLLKGYRYKFVASMVVDGKNKLYHYGEKYNYPFYAGGSIPISSQFDYQSAKYMGDLDRGYSNLKSSSYFNVPTLERFYGEYLDYIPGLKNNEKVMIQMKRASFGAKFIAKGKLAKEGQLEIQITGAPKIMIDLSGTNKQHSDIYTFKNVKAAAEKDTYTETHNVTINWHKPDGTIFPLGTHAITYKRNKTTTVNIEIETSAINNGIGLEIEDTEMTPDDEETTIKDGEIVETEIDTNA
jgi:hypothetical protein